MMTQREAFTEIITIATELGRDDLVEFATERIASLDKKSAKDIEKREANEKLQVAILNALGSVSDPVTVSEILVIDPAFEGLSTQKIASLLRPLVENGKVVKEVVKGKSTYALATVDAEEVVEE